MSFCPKCGSILLPKQVDGKTLMGCSCGYTEVPKEIKEKVEETKEIEVVDKDFEHLPEVDEECPKCKNIGAHYWTKQMRSGDEPETMFYKCKKCKHIWRENG